MVRLMEGEVEEKWTTVAAAAAALNLSDGLVGVS